MRTSSHQLFDVSAHRCACHSLYPAQLAHSLHSRSKITDPLHRTLACDLLNPGTYALSEANNQFQSCQGRKNGDGITTYKYPNHVSSLMQVPGIYILYIPTQNRLTCIPTLTRPTPQPCQSSDAYRHFTEPHPRTPLLSSRDQLSIRPSPPYLSIFQSHLCTSQN